MDCGDNIRGDPAQPNATAMIAAVEAIPGIWERERARQAQADAIAAFSHDQAALFNLYRSKGYPASKAVRLVLGDRMP